MRINLPSQNNSFEIDPRQYGLDTNPTEAIQKAIDQAYEHGGGIVRIPSGTFHLGNQSLRLKSKVSLAGVRGYTKITGGANPSIKAVSSDSLTDIVIEDLHFSNIGAFDIETCSMMVVRHCIFSNITGCGIGWIRNASSVWIYNNYLDGCTEMGLKLEGSSAGASRDIHIFRNEVRNARDNGLAVRAINDSIYHVNISDNIIYNSGKAGIKLTQESVSRLGVKIEEGTISNNLIHGWGSVVEEDGISCNSYKDDQFNNRITIVGNSIRTLGNKIGGILSERSYIGIIRNKNTVVQGNTCDGGVATSGIFGETTSNTIIQGNDIKSACLNSQFKYIATSGGIGLNVCDEINVNGNIVKNTGSMRPGIFVRRVKNSVISANRCYDDQTTKTQSYGIEESDAGGDPAWSSDNLFVGNHCKGNAIEGLRISSRSQQYANFQ